MINKLEFKSEENMQKELKERIANWKEGNSKDGYIERASGKFIYKNIAYLIKVLRYYNHTDKFVSMCDKISDCHVVVEYPEETKDLRDLVESVEEYCEFLYYDTLHTHNQNQTVEEQINECHERAKGDIDRLPSVIESAKEKAQKIEETINKLSSTTGKLNKGGEIKCVNFLV